MEQLIERFETLGANVALFAPRLFGAAAFLIVGGLFAWLLDRAVQAACRRFGIDDSSPGHKSRNSSRSLG